MKSYKELTPKQQRFIDYYDGNATQAADKAGYSNPRQAGSRALSNADIQAALKTREDRERKPKIKSRIDRQEWWSAMMDTAEKDSDRLKASEHLARSHADFTDNLNASATVENLDKLTPRERRARLEALRKKNG